MAQKNGPTDGPETTSGDEVSELENQTEDTNQTDGEEAKQNVKTFTTDEVNKIVERRLKKEREKFEREKDLSEVEKLKAQNEELLKRLSEREAFDDFEAFFGKKGVKNVKGLYRALKDDLEFDKGKISNLKDLLDEAKQTFPEFFPRADGDADGKRGKDGKPDVTNFSDVIRRGFGRR